MVDNILPVPSPIKRREFTNNQARYDALTLVYREWLELNGLPFMCAAELLMDDDVDLNDRQKQYLSEFIKKWEKVDEIVDLSQIDDSGHASLYF